MQKAVRKNWRRRNLWSRGDGRPGLPRSEVPQDHWAHQHSMRRIV